MFGRRVEPISHGYKPRKRRNELEVIKKIRNDENCSWKKKCGSANKEIRKLNLNLNPCWTETVYK